MKYSRMQNTSILTLPLSKLSLPWVITCWRVLYMYLICALKLIQLLNKSAKVKVQSCHMYSIHLLYVLQQSLIGIQEDICKHCRQFSKCSRCWECYCIHRVACFLLSACYLFVGVNINVALDTFLSHVGPGVSTHPLPLALRAFVLSKATLLPLIWS